MLDTAQRPMDLPSNPAELNCSNPGNSHWAAFLREHGRTALLDLPWGDRRTVERGSAAASGSARPSPIRSRAAA